MLFCPSTSLRTPDGRARYHCGVGRPRRWSSLANVPESTQRPELDEHPPGGGGQYLCGGSSESTHNSGSADSSSGYTASSRLRCDAVDEWLDGAFVPAPASCRHHGNVCESCKVLFCVFLAYTCPKTSQGHFIRLPQSQPLEHSANQPTLPPLQPVQLITKEDIASHLQAGKAKDRASPSANRPANESKARRFSTAGPLPRKPQATFAAKARAAQQSFDNKIITMKRPASRTVKQVRETTLQENSRDGTRLKTAAGGTGSLQIVNAINQVESRLSKRKF